MKNTERKSKEMKTKINIINSQKIIKIPLEWRSLVRKACKTTLDFENFPFDAEINVTFVDDETIKEINQEFRNIDSSTDVLSFPLGENGEYDINPENQFSVLGDVIISTAHALTQAELYGHGIDREIAFLTVHSVLHLLGYDHVNDESERREMRKREEQVLKIMCLEIRKED